MIPSLLRDQHRLFLLSRLLMAARRERSEAEQSLDKLHEIIEEKFKPLANQDDLPNEIETYDDLLRGTEEVADLCRFPLLAGRHVVAIGGAFSSGKSSFVNSFLGKNILPTAIERTTALPTYIVNASAEVINAVTHAGRMQQLRKVDFEFLTHNSTRDYNIDLNTFLRYLTISSPSMPFGNIAFLDTPGYSADPQYGLALSDQMIAEQHLRSADAVIWCVDTENGCFRQTDIEFLQRLGHHRPLFVVFNKADKPDPADLPGIKTQAEQTLLNAGLQVSGIAMYSSHFPEEYPAEELTAFLEEINQEKKAPAWQKLISKTLRSYIEFHSHEKDKLAQQISLLNRLTLILEAVVPQAPLTTGKGESRKKTSLADYETQPKPSKSKASEADNSSGFAKAFWTLFQPPELQKNRKKTASERTSSLPELRDDDPINETANYLSELLPTMLELLAEMKERHKSHGYFAKEFSNLGREIETQLEEIGTALDAEIAKGWQTIQNAGDRQLMTELLCDRVATVCVEISENLADHIEQLSLPIKNGTDTREISKVVEVIVPPSRLQRCLPRVFSRKSVSLSKSVTFAFDTPYTYTNPKELGVAFKQWYARLHKETGRKLIETARLRTADLPNDITEKQAAKVIGMAEEILGEIFAQYNTAHVTSWKKLLGGRLGTIKDDGLPIILAAMRRQMTSDLEMLGNIPMHFQNLLGKKLDD